ncbi:MAG: hypothetical protein M3537_07875 [Chloroflexota bacterium]|nr:hypothetical protein [Chloroflexota bacterium]
MREVLDRLIVATQVRYPTVGDLARSIRFRFFDNPLILAARELVYAGVREHLQYLDEHQGAADYAQRIETLTASPEPLIRLLAQRIGGVVGGDAVEEVRVLRRRKRGACEVLQPPQVKPLTYHRMHAADDALLPHASLRWAESELHVRPGDVAHRDRYASADDQDRHVGQDVPQHRGDRVRVG